MAGDRIKRRILFLLILGFTAALHAGVLAGSIDAFITSELPASGAPGLAYAVVVDGEITTAGVRGVVRLGGDTAVTPVTPFVSGSITKSFTALAVMQLVEAGKLGLDDPVSRHLKSFAGRPAGAITLRQLLSHTSGFSTFQGNRSRKDHTPDALAHRVNELADTTPAYAPETKWAYSNANYQVLGRVIEVVSGQTYQDYVATHILEPVGMTHSFVADGEIHDEIATGHRSWFGTKRPLAENRTVRGTAPQGGIVASANDLARYLAVMMNGKDDVLSAKGKAAMMQPANAASPFYGFGWFLDAEDGTVSHSGNTPGCETLALMLPAERKGVVVLVNAGGGMGFGETVELRYGLAARALGLDYAGEGSRWSRQALFLTLACLPVFFALCIIWAWRHRRALRAKSGWAAGKFSLWFPLGTTLASVWVMLDLVPRLNGASFATLNRFQPDLGLLLIATPVMGVLWAVFRLVVAHTGKSGPA